MSHAKGVGCQAKNRGLIPQKLRHFFASFPDAYEIPALPDWLLRRPMGSVWCVPKSPEHQHHSASERRGSRRNRIEPESNAQFLPRRRASSTKRATRVANLTYKNTWSSFLKTSRSDQVKFLPIKSPSSIALGPPAGKPSVRFDQQRHSWDDSVMTERRRTTDTRQQCQSSSPIRRRPVSMRVDSKKYMKLESKALRQAWLAENVFPQFGMYSSRVAEIEPISRNSNKQHHSSYTLNEFVACTPMAMKHRYRQSERRRGSVEANVSSGTTDTFLTPGSLEMSGTSTLPTTSGSVNVNATSSPTSSFDSMQARYSAHPTVMSPPERDHQLYVPDESLETTTSQSVEVQVSSTLTSSTSMQPHLSSSSAGYPNLCVNDLSAQTVARDVLIKERAISSANSRKSCLKERSSIHRQSHHSRPTNFKDPSRLEWTKRYLYTLTPPNAAVHHDRSSSMSRVSSSDPREYQVYTVQQRPWQSNPDLRMEKWKPPATAASSADDSLDDLMKKKKQFLAQLFRERTAEAESYRALRREMRSLALLQSATVPRSHSAGRSRSSDQYASSEEPPKWKGNMKNTSPRQPFHLSTGNLLQGEGKYCMGVKAVAEKVRPLSTPPTPRRKTRPPSAGQADCSDKRFRTSVKFGANPLQSFTAPLQPASGENKASVLRRSMTKKRCEDEMAHNWQQRQREHERKLRLRAIRLDPAWSQVRGADQALEDIAHRRCFKEVVERERLLQYYMDKEEMLNRVWCMPPLFERQAMNVGRKSKKEVHQPPSPPTSPSPTHATSLVTPNQTTHKSAGGIRKKTSFITKSKTEENLDCYLATESLQLSRPSTAKSSTKSTGATKRV